MPWIPWETQKQTIRKKVDDVFAEFEKTGAYKARFEFEIGADEVPDFSYTIRQMLCDVNKVNMKENNESL
jgi:hypothetical protein